MKLDKNIISDIRNKIKISEIISQFLDLKQKGQNYLCLCPFHDDKHASMSVNDNKNIFKCFSCGVSGDVFSFYSKYKNISYYQAILECAKMANISESYIKKIATFNIENEKHDVFYKINYFTNKFFCKFMNNEEASKAHEYLISRGFDDDSIKRFEIGYAPNSNIVYDLLTNKDNIASNSTNFNYYEIEQLGLVNKLKDDIIFFFKDRVTFPIYDEDNNVVGFSARTIVKDVEPKYINTSENIIFHKGEILYNLNNVIKDIETELIYIVEGFMDVLAIRRLGYENVVATMGTAFTPKHLQLLKSRLPNLKIICLCFDNDDAGKTATMNAIKILKQEYSLYVVDYSNNSFKDIDEMYQTNKEQTKNILQKLVSIELYLLRKLINQYPIKNDANKLLILNGSTEILKGCNNEIALNDAIELLSKELQLKEELIIQKILPKYRNKNTSKSFSSKRFNYNVEVEIDTNAKNKHYSGVSVYELEEIIIQLLLCSRNTLNLFERKRFNDLEHEEILNVIIHYYDENPDIDSIKINDLPKMFTDSKIIGKLSEMIVNAENKKSRIDQQSIMKTIETYLKKLKSQWNEKQLMNIKTSSNPDQILLDAINKNKKK